MFFELRICCSCIFIKYKEKIRSFLFFFFDNFLKIVLNGISKRNVLDISFTSKAICTYFYNIFKSCFYIFVLFSNILPLFRKCQKKNDFSWSRDQISLVMTLESVRVWNDIIPNEPPTNEPPFTLYWRVRNGAEMPEFLGSDAQQCSAWATSATIHQALQNQFDVYGTTSATTATAIHDFTSSADCGAVPSSRKGIAADHPRMHKQGSTKRFHDVHHIAAMGPGSGLGCTNKRQRVI